MRYENSENIAVGGVLPSAGTVTIEVLDLLTDTPVVLDSDVCNESAHIPGLYIWTSENISGPIVGYRVLFYRMTDGTNVVQGKFIYGGYINDQKNSATIMNSKLDEVPVQVWGHILS